LGFGRPWEGDKEEGEVSCSLGRIPACRLTLTTSTLKVRNYHYRKSDNRCHKLLGKFRMNLCDKQFS
jgi:hypothetical protein